jgi:pyruvate ferredoxin oxidoreductase alpha subunit
MRDSGWIQLYAETNQEAADLHIQAFRLAEELSMPVMVCMDGFILTHAYERSTSRRRPGRRGSCRRSSRARCSTRRSRSPSAPWSGPEAFMEVRYLAHHKQMQALDLIPQLARRVQGRSSAATPAGCIRSYRAEDAETIVVALGSVNGTIKDVIDELREEGVEDRRRGICSFRPFPLDACTRRRTPSASSASRSPLGRHRRHRLAQPAHGALRHPMQAYTVIAGLGGRPITKAQLRGLFEAVRDELEPLTFLDLNHRSGRASIGRTRTRREHAPRPAPSPDPSAENILRDLAAGGRSAL